jgi:hypothetical protein
VSVDVDIGSSPTTYPLHHLEPGSHDQLTS